MAVRTSIAAERGRTTVYLTEALRNARCARIVWMPLQVSLGIGRIHSFRESKMRVRTVASDVLFTVSALAAVVGVHKYIFGDFPQLWFVRQWPWHAVNPWVACGLHSCWLGLQPGSLAVSTVETLHPHQRLLYEPRRRRSSESGSPPSGLRGQRLTQSRSRPERDHPRNERSLLPGACGHPVSRAISLATHRGFPQIELTARSRTSALCRSHTFR